MNKERSVNSSETACEMRLIISHLVWDQHLLMKYVSVYIIFLMIHLFYPDKTCVLKL